MTGHCMYAAVWRFHFGTKVFFDGNQYYVYGDTGYNRRQFEEIQFQGSNIREAQRLVSKAMSQSRQKWD